MFLMCEVAAPEECQAAPAEAHTVLCERWVGLILFIALTAALWYGGGGGLKALLGRVRE